MWTLVLCGCKKIVPMEDLVLFCFFSSSPAKDGTLSHHPSLTLSSRIHIVPIILYYGPPVVDVDRDAEGGSYESTTGARKPPRMAPKSNGIRILHLHAVHIHILLPHLVWESIESTRSFMVPF